MNYITSIEASKKWNVNLRSVQLYCANNKIPGAVRRGRQWFIPEDALKPVDERKAEARQSQDKEPYHFPVFVYTRYFLAFSELSANERCLLDAQLLNLRGEFSESVRICRSLINEQTSTSVVFGSLFTNYINYMLMGLTSEMAECKNAMETIMQDAEAHQEDYRLIIAFIEHTYRFDPARYLTVDVSKLSPDALTTYKIVSLCVIVFSANETSESVIRFIEASCREIELSGITPASINVHSVLSVLYSCRGNYDSALRHIDDACRLGFEGGYFRLLAKCSSLDLDNFYKCLVKYGKHFAADIKSRCARYRSNWQLAYTIHSGPNPAIDINIFEAEIMLLVINKTSMEDIAFLKNVPAKEVRNTIKDLCKRLSVKSKKELIELFKATYSYTPGEQSGSAAPSAAAKP